MAEEFSLNHLEEMLRAAGDCPPASDELRNRVLVEAVREDQRIRREGGRTLALSLAVGLVGLLVLLSYWFQQARDTRSSNAWLTHRWSVATPPADLQEFLKENSPAAPQSHEHDWQPVCQQVLRRQHLFDFLIGKPSATSLNAELL